MNTLNSKQLRDLEIIEAVKFKSSLKRNNIIFILENIYDTYNVGGLFRLADSLAVEKIYLCGQMEVPPNHKIAKASVGTDKIVPWEYKDSALDAISEIRELNKKNNDGNYSIYAVEQASNSLPYTSVDFDSKIAILVGNETFGVTEETLKAVDKILEIPMWGVNKSLNVIVSCAIVSYHAANKMKTLEPRAGIEPAL